MKSAGRGASSPPLGQSATLRVLCERAEPEHARRQHGPARLRALREERGHRASFAGHARPCSSPLIPCMLLAARVAMHEGADLHGARLARTGRATPQHGHHAAPSSEEPRAPPREKRGEEGGAPSCAPRKRSGSPAPAPHARHPRLRRAQPPAVGVAQRGGRAQAPLARESICHEPARARRARGRRQIWRPRDGDEQDFLTCPDLLHRLSGLPPRRAPPRIAPPRRAPRRGA